MRFSRFINPLIVFIGIQLVWVAVLVFWIVWFVGSHKRLRTLAEHYSPELLEGGIDWFILVEGILLLVAILIGVYVIFLFWRRQSSLLRAQRHFIAQVTHELKSPLASLQLHIETIRRRRPSPEKMQVFLDTMLADTDRLGILINNLLSANRLEQRRLKLTLRPCNLSELTTEWFRRRQFSLPRAGRMTLDIAPGLFASLEPESMETVFRNLLENAVLYSERSPDIRVVLRAEGNLAHFSLTDQGKGIDVKEQKKVFHMFYRIRRVGDSIRGSGLGLFIVRATVRLHGGKVWLESQGSGRGTTVHLHLPLLKERSEGVSDG